MKRFVLGFLICPSTDSVLLINKLRPDAQKGRLNGIGGHVEKESPRQAMLREMKEETGLEVPDWEPYVVLRRTSVFECVVYRAFTQDMPQPKALTDELPEWVTRSQLSERQQVPDITWLIPLAYEQNLDGPAFISLT